MSIAPLQLAPNIKLRQAVNVTILCMFKMTLYYVKVYIDYYIRLENVHT